MASRYTVDRIKEIDFDVIALRKDGEFYYVDWADRDSETFFAFYIDDQCKIDYEFTYEDLAESDDVELYCLELIERN